MYIKQITIQGFKSYKNQTLVEPFSPKLNVVVGRNGSGKSNFFHAIRFVLADDYNNMAREDRQALLHEGTGTAVMSAYVEIVFANCQGRFQTANDEVVLRRTIGLKKDEYSVDRKNTTKHEVMQMLETAGFSRANPYYIVPQGRITRLTNMTDAARLDVLKSVAGTHHFTTKKTESLKIMNDTNNKLAEIDDLFNQINDRLTDLEEEQEELRDFQDKDKQKRGLEYTLFHRDQEKINHTLASIENKRAGGVDEADGDRDELADSEEALAEIMRQIEVLKQAMNAAKLEKKQLEDERREKAKANAQVDLEVKHGISNRDAAENAKIARNKDLQNIRAQITQAESELATIKPHFDSDSDKEKAIKAQLDEAEATQQRLYAKQGRSARFKTKKDRDTWLQAQVDETFESLSRFKATKMQTAEGVKEDQETIKNLEKEVERLQKALSEGAESFDVAIQEQIDNKERLTDERKLLWRKEAQSDSQKSAAQDALRTAERTLSHTMDGNISRGLDAVRWIKEQYSLDGIYGTLAELIDVPQHHTAVEVVAGNSLFHWVCDNDATASKCMQILNKERLGRATFMPLNQLHPRVASFPQAGDARPLMSLINYDPQYEKAVQQVFGKAIIAQNLSVASQYARTHNLTAVTPEGDRSDTKGALTGGFHDSKKSRLKAMKAVADARVAYEQVMAESSKIQKQDEILGQKITKVTGEVQKLEQQRNKAQSNQRQLRADLKTQTELLERKHTELDDKRKQVEVIDGRVQTLSSTQEAYSAELQSDFKKTLSDAEEKQLEKLTPEIQKRREQYNKVASSRAESEAKKTNIDVRLKSYLQPQLSALEAAERDAASDESAASLESRQRELDRLKKDLRTITSRLTEVEDTLEDRTTRINELESQASETRRRQEELTKSIERHERRLERNIQRKAQLLAEKQNTIESIRDLGAVPEDMKTKYRNIDDKEILKRLQKVKESLKKYTKVNRHAYEHYKRSMQQREELDQRREELIRGKESIQKLIEMLDQRKDEAIQRTFKQVSKAFSEVFMKLVPAGRGMLRIKKITDKTQPGEEEDEEGEAGARQGKDRDISDNYTGVAIEVSFNSKHDDQQRIQQLSGGQKSLCSLALIFAIQATDPAPFYIFDEIDANLDAQYRTAVAEHLQYLANQGNANAQNGEEEQEEGRLTGGQFVCTTFRPEMLRVADKCYGVTFANNVSNIRVETRANALDFVESQAQ